MIRRTTHSTVRHHLHLLTRPTLIRATNALVQRVRKTALSLARAVARAPSPADRAAPDLLTVELAALLHDVLDKKYVSAADAADPYAFFLPFFIRMAAQHGPSVDLVADGRARLVARVVENVSWTTEKKLRAAGAWSEWHESCVELHCVQDADRLDAIGAFGSRPRCLYRFTPAN